MTNNNQPSCLIISLISISATCGGLVVFWVAFYFIYRSTRSGDDNNKKNTCNEIDLELKPFNTCNFTDEMCRSSFTTFESEVLNCTITIKHKDISLIKYEGVSWGQFLHYGNTINAFFSYGACLNSTQQLKINNTTALLCQQSITYDNACVPVSYATGCINSLILEHVDSTMHEIGQHSINKIISSESSLGYNNSSLDLVWDADITKNLASCSEFCDYGCMGSNRFLDSLIYGELCRIFPPHLQEDV